MEQGSYMLIERGMTVRGTDGDIGSVAEVIADEGIDVFRGLVVTHGLLLHKQHFVPADCVTGVLEKVVLINLSKAEAEALPAPGAPSVTQTDSI